MPSLVLINPVRRNQYYVNPLRLQIIEAKILEQYPPDALMVEIADAENPNRFEHLMEKSWDCAIVDVPEGAIRELADLGNRLQTRHVLLTGNTIKYGLSEVIENTLRPVFPQGYSVFANDGELVEALDNMPEIQQSCQLRTGPITQGLNLRFPQWMLDEWRAKGIQIYLEGLSRGCEHHCSFCRLSVSGPSGHVRQTRVDAVSAIASLSLNLAGRRPYVQFVDENFFGGGAQGLRRIQKLCERLEISEAEAIIGIDTRIDSVINRKESDDDALLRKQTWRKLASLGLKYCFLGFESASGNQLARYEKGIDPNLLADAIGFLEQLGIEYTVGLILWDPMMSVSDIANSLDFIEEHELIGKTASLLKPLRIYARAKYRQRYGSEFLDKSLPCTDAVLIDAECVRYRDPDVREILPIALRYYHLFNQAGYRHSDVACFEPLYGDEAPRVLRELPHNVSTIEFELLRMLISQDMRMGKEDIITTFDERCLHLSERIIEELSGCSLKGAYEPIVAYYRGVFGQVRKQLIDG